MLSEDRKLFIRVITFELTQHKRPRYYNVTDGRTDGRLTIAIPRLHYVHRAVKMRSVCKRGVDRSRTFLTMYKKTCHVIFLRQLRLVGVAFGRGTSRDRSWSDSRWSIWSDLRDHALERSNYKLHCVSKITNFVFSHNFDVCQYFKKSFWCTFTTGNLQKVDSWMAHLTHFCVTTLPCCKILIAIIVMLSPLKTLFLFSQYLCQIS